MAKKTKAQRYFIVNPAGAIHEVDREHAQWRLNQVGYRMATKAEADLYLKTKVQTVKAPLAAPHSTDPDIAIDVAELEAPEAAESEA